MIVREVNINDSSQIEKIKKFIDGQLNIDVKQTIEWGILRKEKKYLLYIEDDNENIICYANSFECKDTFVNDTSLYISRGPVYDKDKISLEECLLVIFKFAIQKNIKFIRVNSKVSNIDFNYLKNNNCNIEIINRNEYAMLKESPVEAVVYLKNKNEENLLYGFHYKTRYNIRKSLKNGLVTKISNNIDLEKFYELYIETAKRHDFKPHEKNYFMDLINIYKDKIIFCSVEYKNEFLAMSINIKQSNALYYLYGVSSLKNRNLFPCYNMHWNMIKYALSNNIDEYNFGGVFADKEDINNKDYGLMIFKSRFCDNGFTKYLPDIIIK